MRKSILALALVATQFSFAGTIDRIESFKLEKLNKLASVLKPVADFEISGNCGSVDKLNYSDENLSHAAVIASISGQYTEEVGVSPASFDDVVKSFEELIQEGAELAQNEGDKERQKIIAKARKELATLDLLDDVNVYVGGSSGAFSSSHSSFVVLDYVNKEVLSFSDGYCE
jgi:hypothetical protein